MAVKISENANCLGCMELSLARSNCHSHRVFRLTRTNQSINIYLIIAVYSKLKTHTMDTVIMGVQIHCTIGKMSNLQLSGHSNEIQCSQKCHTSYSLLYV